MSQLYNLGKKLKDRYISGDPFHFLPSRYDGSQVRTWPPDELIGMHFIWYHIIWNWFPRLYPSLLDSSQQFHDESYNGERLLFTLWNVSTTRKTNLESASIVATDTSVYQRPMGRSGKLNAGMLLGLNVILVNVHNLPSYHLRMASVICQIVVVLVNRVLSVGSVNWFYINGSNYQENSVMNRMQLIENSLPCFWIPFLYLLNTICI